jgi:hypothetical protein
VVIGYGYFSGETAFGLEVRCLVGESPIRNRSFPDHFSTTPGASSASLRDCCVTRHLKLNTGGEEERYFAPLRRAGRRPCRESQGSRDGGLVPNHKVPGEIGPESLFSSVPR